MKIEEVHEHLKKSVESVDPIEACYIAEKMESMFGQSIYLPEIFDRDFYYASKNHKELTDIMINDGILDNFLLLKKKIIREVRSFLYNNTISDISNYHVHEIHISYEPKSFELIRILNFIKYVPREEIYENNAKFISAKQGEIIYTWKIGLGHEKFESFDMNDYCLNQIMNRIYRLRYFEDSEV